MTYSLEWLGGLIVGEGCFFMSLRTNRQRAGSKKWVHLTPGFSITMTDLVVMERIAEALEEYGFKFHVHNSDSISRAGHRPAKTIQMHGQVRTLAFTEVILPYLDGQKKEAAQAVLDFCKHRLSVPGRRGHGSGGLDDVDVDCFLRCRAANARNGVRKWTLSDLRDYTVDRENRTCSSCGGGINGQTAGCNTCAARHYQRRKTLKI